MITEKQLLANRRNAQLSTGPNTAEGKKISSMNALRHCLTGQITVTTPEEQQAHDSFCEDIVACLAPETALERQFAQSVADDHWRLNRARSIENNIFTLATNFMAAEARLALENSQPVAPPDAEGENPEIDRALSAARAFIADPERFQLLTIYEQRIHRNMEKNLKQLTQLQAARLAEQKALHDKAFEEARLLAQLAESEGVTYDPTTDYPDPNGFVFSNDEINQSIQRERRLDAARNAFPPLSKHQRIVKRAA